LLYEKGKQVKEKLKETWKDEKRQFRIVKET
jgi:hypothetical protein